MFAGKAGGLILVLWYYGYNGKIEKLPVVNAEKSDFPRLCENDIFWETRIYPIAGAVFRENVSHVTSVKPSALSS